jgi:hypothetical protein
MDLPGHGFESRMRLFKNPCIGRGSTFCPKAMWSEGASWRSLIQGDSDAVQVTRPELHAYPTLAKSIVLSSRSVPAATAS